MEPCKWREWAVASGRLFTCARPGRSQGKFVIRVPDRDVDEWLRGIEKKVGPRFVVLSLLGTKQDGTSEYSFYSFRGGSELDSGAPTMGEWIAKKHPELEVSVREYPTVDFEPIGEDVTSQVIAEIKAATGRGEAVILMDSGGEQRTGDICKRMSLAEALPPSAPLAPQTRDRKSKRGRR
jgi:hypothetical protein